MTYFDIDKLIPNTNNFKWAEALYLRKWQIHACPEKGVINNVVRMGFTIQHIRGYFGKPIKIHSWWRPKLYNEFVGGASESGHLYAKAIDFSVQGLDCDVVRERIEPMLEELNIRMEDVPGANWVHIDCKKPGLTGRFFKP